MAYDPQAARRRPRPAEDAPAPVDSIIGDRASTGDGPAQAGPARSPTHPTVTPEPADPPPDTLVFNTGLAGVVAAIMGLLLLRHLWMRRRHRRAARESAGSL